MWASSCGPARPRAIGCDGAGGWVIASQERQESFSRSPRLLRHPPVDPFQQISQLRRRDGHRSIRRRGPDEASALQPFGEQAHALAVVPENLDQRAAPAAEHE